MIESVFRLDGKTILVVGASSGLGQRSAEVLSEFGATLILTGRNQSALSNTLASCKQHNHVILPADISKPADISSLAGQLPQIDGLLYSAGINKRLPLKNIRSESLDAVIEVNFKGFLHLIQALHSLKKIKPNASIVAVSSISTHKASLGNILYMSSKGALDSAIRGLALEFSQYGIRVNGVRPGLIVTNLTKGLTDEMIQNEQKKYPLGRLGNADDVAYAVVFLLSDVSAWITGSFITIDGGLSVT